MDSNRSINPSLTQQIFMNRFFLILCLIVSLKSVGIASPDDSLMSSGAEAVTENREARDRSTLFDLRTSPLNGSLPKAAGDSKPLFASESFSGGFSSVASTDGSSRASSSSNYEIKNSKTANRIFKSIRLVNESTQGSTGTLNFAGHRFATAFAHDLSPTQELNVGCGINTLQASRGSTADPFTDALYSLSFRQTIENTAVTIDTSRDLFYFSAPNSDSLSNRLRSQSTNLGAEFSLNKKTKGHATLSNQMISDGNNGLSFDSAYLYSISGVWAGIGASFQHFDQQRWAYWTPVRNFAVGPRMEFSENLTKDLFAHGSLSLGCGNDEGGALGFGTYNEFGLAYQIDALNVSLNYVGFGAAFSPDGWFQKSVSIAAAANF